MAEISEKTAMLEEPLIGDSPWRLKEWSVNKWVYGTQWLSWPLLYLFFNLFFKLEIKGRKNLQLIKSPFILVANHFSTFDSFMFRVIFGCFTSHLPLRFMAVRKFDSPLLNFFYYIGIIPFIYWLFGVFVVVPGAGLEKNLKKPCEILENGGNVVIYPEGKINKGGGITNLKKGAAALSQFTGCPLVPIVFRPNPRNLVRKEVFVNVGSPINVPKGVSLESATERLHTIMQNMYNYD